MLKVISSISSLTRRSQRTIAVSVVGFLLLGVIGYAVFPAPTESFTAASDLFWGNLILLGQPDANSATVWV